MERETDETQTFVYPVNLNTFAPPNDKALNLAYKVHKPSYESLTLISETGRTIYTEAFIENPQLGTLADLCVRALALEYGTQCIPIFAKDPLRLRKLFDSIDIESPLERIYKIDDTQFWKRLVLAKTKDKTLPFQDDNFDWKSLGISLKYEELVEECPAEFWPEKKMEALAEKIKDNVKELHIHKLQSLQDYVFEKYLLRDSDTDKSDSTDVSSTTAEEAESVADGMGEEEGEEEQQAEIKETKAIGDVASFESSEGNLGRGEVSFAFFGDFERINTYQLEWSAFEARRAEEKTKVIEERRTARRERREAQQRRRDRREEKQLLRKEQAEMPKPKTIKVKSVFDLPIDEVEDNEYKKIDKRNPKTFLAQKKSYDYPPKHCHHIDLKFVRLFDNLEEFSLEFHPPPLYHKYHTRHFNFSYKDIENLANGISNLETLRIFRLRDSRMDERKLRILTAVLKNLNVEEVDFRNDQLRDDCDDAIYDLFQGTTTIKSLELEGNLLNSNGLRRLSMALRKYEGGLEYLGLARNPLTDEALHVLCSILHKTAQVQRLCLSGIQFTQRAIKCCIANELLRKHTILKDLEIVGMSIGSDAAKEIIMALKGNEIILGLDCRGCNLTFEFEFEIEVCIRRNRYIVENPYIGDPSKTEEEIKEYVSRLKNPVLLKVKEEMEKRQICMENLPDIAERFSMASIDSANVRKHSESVISLLPFEKRPTVESKRVSFMPEPEEEPFTYKPNEFDFQEFHAHISLPGPGQRYYYFNARKERVMCTTND